MENDSIINPEQGSTAENRNEPTHINDDGTEFENPNVDPGFDFQSDDNSAENGESSNKLVGRDDKRTGDIDSNKSVSEMREEFEQKQNDATNLNNDRENGSFNPKNI
jgi:hypothetical protein